LLAVLVEYRCEADGVMLTKDIPIFGVSKNGAASQMMARLAEKSFLPSLDANIYFQQPPHCRIGSRNRWERGRNFPIDLISERRRLSGIKKIELQFQILPIGSLKSPISEVGGKISTLNNFEVFAADMSGTGGFNPKPNSRNSKESSEDRGPSLGRPPWEWIGFLFGGCMGGVVV
jgi:hypothetical protein